MMGVTLVFDVEAFFSLPSFDDEHSSTKKKMARWVLEVASLNIPHLILASPSVTTSMTSS